VKQYYHDFKVCIQFGGLDVCIEDVMSRFMRGLNSEIRTMLILESCNHISYLFCLARKAENQMLSYMNTCKNDMTHDDSHLSTLHANPQQQIVESAADCVCHNMICLPNLVTKMSFVTHPWHHHN
jgi:hypothetical protein